MKKEEEEIARPLMTIIIHTPYVTDLRLAHEGDWKLLLPIIEKNLARWQTFVRQYSRSTPLHRIQFPLGSESVKLNQIGGWFVPSWNQEFHMFGMLRQEEEGGGGSEKIPSSWLIMGKCARDIEKLHSLIYVCERSGRSGRGRKKENKRHRKSFGGGKGWSGWSGK